MVIGEKAGLECKTTSSWEVAKQLKEGEIPSYWYCQCVHYMMVTGADRWYLGALAFGEGFFEFTIERDEAEIASLSACEKEFWDLVVNDQSPTLDGSEATTEALKTIYKESSPGTLADLTAVGSNSAYYNEISKQIKDLEAIKAEQENIIKDYMGDREKGSFGNTTISWKSSSRRTFDKSAYEADHGKISDQYYNTTSVRTFRVTVKKGA